MASPDKLSIIVFSGDFARVHYALVMAGAAAIDRANLRTDIDVGHGGAAAFIRDASSDGTVLFV